MFVHTYWRLALLQEHVETARLQARELYRPMQPSI